MSLLRDIQDAALDSKVNLPDLLRKCKVLAVRLGNEDFKRWVDNELNGYRNNGDLPDYRILNVESKGHFSGYFGSGLRNAPIPTGCLPEDFKDLASKHYYMEPISALVEIVSNSASHSFQSPWPADIVAIIGNQIYQVRRPRIGGFLAG